MNINKHKGTIAARNIAATRYMSVRKQHLLMNKTIKIFLISLFSFLFASTVAQEHSTFDSLELALSQEIDTKKKQDILIELTDLYLSPDPGKALVFAEQTLELADKINHEINKLKAFLQIGEIYWSLSEYHKSLEICYMANSLAEKLNMEREYAESQILISRNYYVLGDFEKCSDLNFQALGTFEKYNDKRGICSALNQIGHNYFGQNNFDNALIYYQQSLAVAREIDDLKGVARGLNNIAAAYGNKGDFVNYKINLKEAAKIIKKTDKRMWEGSLYLNLGNFYLRTNVTDSSLYYYHKALEIFKESKNSYKLSNIYIALAGFYSFAGNNDSSLYYALSAFNLGKEKSIKRTMFSASSHLYKYYYEHKDLENTYKYLNIHYQMKDSLNIEKNMTRVAQLELLSAVEKKNQEKKIRQQRREYTYIISGTIITFFLIILVIIIIARNRIKRKNEEIEKRTLKSKIEIRDKELISNVMTLLRKNEILSEITDKLMDIRNSAAREETKSAIIRIVKELQKAKDTEIWDEFDTRFRQVNTEFYDKLHQRFPELSPNELKICAFLQLNMSTKEISELTGKSINTIDVARSRLRRKLGISNTNTNLVSFLSQI